MDLRSGQPVPGVALSIEAGFDPLAQRRVTTTDSDGAFLIPAVGHVTSADTSYLCAPPRIECSRLIETGNLQVLPTARVTISVELIGLGQDEPVRGGIYLRRPTDFQAEKPENPESYSKNELWISRAGLASRLIAHFERSPKSPGPKMLAIDELGQARTTFQVPLLRGYMVLAKARGWRAGAVRLPETPFPGETLSLVMNRANAIRGTLLDDEGAAIGGVEVQLQALLRQDEGPAPYWDAQDQDLGFGVLTSNRTGKTGLSFCVATVTDRHGRFVIWMPLDGYDAYLVSKPPGHAPARTTLGPVSSDIGPVRLVAKKLKAEAPRVVLRNKGQVLSGQPFTLLDITDEHRQEQKQVTTDESGTFSSALLEHGRLYAVVYRIPGKRQLAHGCFAWTGRDGYLDLSEMEKDPDRLRQR